MPFCVECKSVSDPLIIFDFQNFDVAPFSLRLPVKMATVSSSVSSGFRPLGPIRHPFRSTAPRTKDEGRGTLFLVLHQPLGHDCHNLLYPRSNGEVTIFGDGLSFP